MAMLISPLTGTLKSLKTQFINKEKLLSSSVKIQKKRIEAKRQNAEREKYIGYETALEKPLSFLGRPIRKITKKLGFLEAIKTFIVNLLMGFIALRLIKYLPQFIQFATGALKVGNFILNSVGNVLNALVTFVDYGYKAYDHARKIVGKVGGEKAIASLDKATSETTKVMNQLFIAAMLFSDFSPFSGLGGASAVFNKSVDAIKDRVSGEVANAAVDAATKTAGKAALGPLASAGIIIGAGLLLSAAGEGVFQLTNWAKNLMGFGPIAQFFKVPLGILEGVGTLFDILGAPFRYGIELIRAGFMKMFNMKDGLEKQAKNLGKFDARIRENFRRFSGIFAPVFSFFGQEDTAKKLSTPGSFGSLYGEKAVKDMGYGGGGKVVKIKKYAEGGTASRAEGDDVFDKEEEKEKEVNIERTEISKSAKLNPGSSVGGIKNFLKVFPNTDDEDRMDRYTYMTDSYYTISGIPSLGNVMSLTVKSLLGDQVTKSDYDGAASSLSSLMMEGLYEQNPYAYGRLSSAIKIKEFNGILSNFLMDSMSGSFGAIVGLLKSQVGLILNPDETTSATQTGSESPDDMVEGSVPGGQLTMEQLVGLAKGAGFSENEAVIMAAIAKAESGGNSNAKNFKPPDKSYGLWQINMIGRLGPARMKEYGLQSEDQLFDPVTNAKAAYAIRKSQGLGAWTVYKTGKYRAHLTAAEAARSAPSLSTSPTSTKIKPVSLSSTQNKGASTGVINDREWNTGIPLSSLSTKSGKSFKVASVVSGQFAGFISDLEATGYKIKSIGGYREAGTGGGTGPADPDYDKERYSHPYGAAIDINPDQNPYGKSLVTDMPSNISQIAAKHGLGWGGNFRRTKDAMHFSAIKNEGGNRDFSFFKQSGKETGGSTLLGGIRLLHRGEYVIDKDSVDLFGGNSFFSMINGIENERQRGEKSSTLIQHLSKYTGRKIDQRPQVIVEDPEVVVMPSQPIYVNSGSSGYSSGGGSDWEYHNLELR